MPPANPLLRQKFFEEKLCDITNRIVSSFNFDTENLLNDIDLNIQKSRETFKLFEEKFKLIPDQQWTELLERVRELLIFLNRAAIMFAQQYNVCIRLSVFKI